MKARIKAGGFILVASKPNRVVGMLEFAPPDRISMLFVSLRHHGIAEELLASAIRRIRSENPAVSKLIVHSSRYAKPFYMKMGSHQVGDVPPDHGITYIPMERMTFKNAIAPGCSTKTEGLIAAAMIIVRLHFAVGLEVTGRRLSRSAIWDNLSLFL